jgi:hypothetical protein
MDGWCPSLNYSLGNLGVLGVSAVNRFERAHGKDAENAEIAQRIEIRTLAQEPGLTRFRFSAILSRIPEESV